MSAAPALDSERKRIDAQRGLDTRYAELMARHFDRPERLVQDWLLYVKRHHQLSRLLHHYELFRMVREVPGSIAECGVFRGETLLLWAKMLEIFCMGDRSRVVYGFDHFQGLRDLCTADGPENAAMHRGAYDGGDDFEQLQTLIELFDADRFAPGKPRIELVDGDARETLPRWAEENPGVRLSVLHLDFHPANVKMTKQGPVVIDWANAARGNPDLDAALTYTILRTARAGGSTAIQTAVAALRRRFAEAFLEAAGGDTVRAQIREAAELRLLDRNLLSEERGAVFALARGELD